MSKRKFIFIGLVTTLLVALHSESATARSRTMPVWGFGLAGGQNANAGVMTGAIIASCQDVACFGIGGMIGAQAGIKTTATYMEVAAGISAMYLNLFAGGGGRVSKLGSGGQFLFGAGFGPLNAYTRIFTGTTEAPAEFGLAMVIPF